MFKIKNFVVVVMLVVLMMVSVGCSKGSDPTKSTPIIFNVTSMTYENTSFYYEVCVRWNIQYTNPSERTGYYFVDLEWGDGITSRSGDGLPHTVGGGVVTQSVYHSYDGVEKGQTKNFTLKATFTYKDRPEIDPVVVTLPITIHHP